ncbi:MAG: hypothetical protein ACE5OW_03685 [Candidatus Bathyarchaeia archaeon]
MPVTKYRFSISFEVGEAYRVEVRDKVVNALTTLKNEGKISKITGSIDEFIEYEREPISI